VKIGIPIIDPGTHALGCSIGESKVNVNDDSVVAQLEGNGDRLGLRLVSRFGCALGERCGIENEEGESCRKSHGKIVAGRKDCAAGDKGQRRWSCIITSSTCTREDSCRA